MEDRSRWLRILVPVVLVGTAAALMLHNLHQPNRIIFDEVYYVNDSRDILEYGVEQGFVVHPQVGKLLIAFSIWLFGDNPVGWRVVGAVTGAATVGMTYMIGRRLFRRMAPAALAALLLMLDGAFVVQARTAMLDIYLAFFTVLGAWALTVHVQRTRAIDDGFLAEGLETPDRLPARPVYLVLMAGVAFGLAVATKWSGVLGLGGAGLLMIGTELGRRRRILGGSTRRLGRAFGLIATALVVVPLATYLVAWTPWFVAFPNSYEARQTCGSVQDCEAVSFPGRAAALWSFHARILDFHLSLQATHPYRAPAYTWPLQARPVVYYYETCDSDRAQRVPSTNDDGKVEVPSPCAVPRGKAGEVLALGNPALWWTFLAAGVLLIGGMIHRDRRAMIPMTFVAAQFLPWFLVARPVFSFYAVPMVPFLALGVAAAIARIGDRRPWVSTVVGGLVGGVSVAGIVGLWDLIAGDPTRAVYGLCAAGGVAAGAAVGAWRSQRSDPDRPVADPPATGSPGWTPTATWVTAAVAVAAVGLAVYFMPIWFGVPLDESAVRARWWFRGWI